MTKDDTANIDNDKTDQTNLVDKVSEKRVVVSEMTESGRDSTYTTAVPGIHSPNEYGIFGEGSQISTNQERESTVFFSDWLKFESLPRKQRTL